MTRVSQVGLLVFLFLLLQLQACSSNKTSELLNYGDSEITPTLEIPPNLIERSNDKNLTLPGSKAGKASNTGRYVETGNLNVEPRTLPKVEGLSIQGQGDTYWLEVAEKAEYLYPGLRNFWSEQGFQLSKDEPALGVMETEWLEVKSGSDSFFASLLSSLTGADSKDQFVTRIERGADDKTSLVFIAHRGQVFILDDSESNHDAASGRGWQLMAADTAKEVEMMSRLMIYLGMQDQAVKTELDKLGLFAARASIQYDEDDEESYLLLNHGFQQSWNRTLHQLDRLGVLILQKTREQNRGTIKLDSTSIALDPPLNITPGFNQLSLSLRGSSNSGQTRVDVLNNRGDIESGDISRAVLNLLMSKLK